MLEYDLVEGCLPKRRTWLVVLFILASRLSRSAKLDLDVSAYVDLLIGTDCIFSIAAVDVVEKLSEPVSQARFLHEHLQSDGAFTKCLTPSDVQDGVEYEAFLGLVKEAVLSEYSDGAHGMIQIECMGLNDEPVVAYAWKSFYSGKFWDGNPLPLHQTKGALLKLRGFFSAEAARERKERKKLTLRDEMAKSVRKTLVGNKSFEAFQYCYEMYLLRKRLLEKLRLYGTDK